RLKTASRTLISSIEKNKRHTGSSGEFDPGKIPFASAETITFPFMDVLFTASSAVTAPNATAKLLIGPTTEVNTSSRTGFLKLLEFTGVGLAQPRIPQPENAAM